MIKLNSLSPSLTLPPVSSLEAGSVRRLMVLIPDIETDHVPVIRRVWELAHAFGCDVLFLGKCRDAAEEPRLRRALVTMSALVQDGKVFTGAKVEIGTSWVDAVRRNYQAGDMIVCFAEQRTGLFHTPLDQILRSNLEAPIYILSGLFPQNQPGFNILSFIALWGGLISIFVGSFLLQIRLGSLPRDATQTILLILSVLAELWLIWVWNNLFS